MLDWTLSAIWNCQSRNWYTMKSIIALCLISAVLPMPRTNQEWQMWKKTHQKNYLNMEEENYRREVWEKNLNYVNIHNSRLDKQFTLHMNHFADRDSRKDHLSKHGFKLSEIVVDHKAQSTFDWREKGVVTPVTNQGQTGDSQAIVAAESVSSFHAVATGQLYDLSVEEIIGCGCGSQLAVKDIFGCIHNKIGGLCTKSDYKPSSNSSCNKNSCSPVAKVGGSVFINRGDEEEMGKAILKTPLMAYVDASQPSFMTYQSGVYSDPECNPTDIDHVLQIVGYGQVDNTDYWICKNSWGSDWGQAGYIWIERGKNMCGIATMALYPY